ncbi:IS21 family transposase [Bifidobacterium longum subsp. longum]|nr:IS21 family transposase [Bifidobacterium longum subsp. longum]TCF91676.1 IS21 family transposase [Bifidobacterium longum subsp. longum]
MAIPMPIVQDIRRLDRQGMSRAQIARRLHVDRGTVAKYADMEDCSPKPKADRRYGSKIDPYAHLVDGWLEADRLLPRKQRHTIRRVCVCSIEVRPMQRNYSVRKSGRN